MLDPDDTLLDDVVVVAYGTAKKSAYTGACLLYTSGIGFDRSSKGTDAVGQYPEPYRSLYDNIETCPELSLIHIW